MDLESEKPDRREFLGAPLRRQDDSESPRSMQSNESDNLPFGASAPNRTTTRAELGMGRPEASLDHFLQHFTHRAMGTEFQLLLNFGQYRHAAEAAMSAFEFLDAWENRMSIFRAQSDISRINRIGFEADCVVPPDVFAVLKYSQTLSLQTKGAFDITTTPLSRIWGFLSRRPAVPTQEQINQAKELVGPAQIRLNDNDHSVRLAGQNVEINLHAIGKGIVIDGMRALLWEQGIRDFVLHGGQSSAFASGNPTGKTNGDCGWRIGLSHPLFPEQRIAEFDLVDLALGTSGSARQGLVFEGRRLGHILDPTTGRPAEYWLSTTVFHRDSATCDALATAFYVMSEGDVADYCRRNKDVSAILIRSLDKRPMLELLTFNSPPVPMFCEHFQHLPVREIAI